MTTAQQRLLASVPEVIYESMTFEDDAQSRLTASTEVTALTHEQFSKWEKARQSAYLKQHPNSSFAKGGDKSGDSHRDRLKRTPPRGSGQLGRNGGVKLTPAQYHFTDNSGKKHTYKNASQINQHHTKLDRMMAKHASKYNAAKTPEEKSQHMQSLRDLHDHARALTDLARNKTARKELNFDRGHGAHETRMTPRDYIRENAKNSDATHFMDDEDHTATEKGIHPDTARMAGKFGVKLHRTGKSGDNGYPIVRHSGTPQGLKDYHQAVMRKSGDNSGSTEFQPKIKRIAK